MCIPKKSKKTAEMSSKQKKNITLRTLGVAVKAMQKKVSDISRVGEDDLSGSDSDSEEREVSSQPYNDTSTLQLQVPLIPKKIKSHENTPTSLKVDHFKDQKKKRRQSVAPPALQHKVPEDKKKHKRQEHIDAHKEISAQLNAIKKSLADLSGVLQQLSDEFTDLSPVMFGCLQVDALEGMIQGCLDTYARRLKKRFEEDDGDDDDDEEDISKLYPPIGLKEAARRYSATKKESLRDQILQIQQEQQYHILDTTELKADIRYMSRERIRLISQLEAIEVKIYKLADEFKAAKKVSKPFRAKHLRAAIDKVTEECLRDSEFLDSNSYPFCMKLFMCCGLG